MTDNQQPDNERRIEEAKKRMDWDDERRGEPTLLEYLRYYRSGEIGEIHIQAVIDSHTEKKVRSEIERLKNEGKTD